MRPALLLVCVVALAFGLLFVGQGLGIVRWPETSFMIDQKRWVYYGAGIATVAGFFIFVLTRR